MPTKSAFHNCTFGDCFRESSISLIWIVFFCYFDREQHAMNSRARIFKFFPHRTQQQSLECYAILLLLVDRQANFLLREVDDIQHASARENRVAETILRSNNSSPFFCIPPFCFTSHWVSFSTYIFWARSVLQVVTQSFISHEQFAINFPSPGFSTPKSSKCGRCVQTFLINHAKWSKSALAFFLFID